MYMMVGVAWWVKKEQIESTTKVPHTEQTQNSMRPVEQPFLRCFQLVNV
jgi:hypothetical protein